MREPFITFLMNPGSDTFQAVRTLVVGDPNYHPYGDDLNALIELVNRRAFDEVGPRFQAALPTLLLSPRAHFLVAMAARERGDAEQEKMERMIFAACVDGILSTGDGSLERPYLVTSTDDEYTILQVRGLESTGQSLLAHEGRSLDRHACSDGSEMYFDVTDLLAVLHRQLRPPGPEPGEA